MRKKFIAGNWKMNLNTADAVTLATGLKNALGTADIDVAICPTMVQLTSVINVVNGSPIGVGAQNVYFENNGAFTGETSIAMLKDIACDYVIIGHSERRHVLGECNETINKKIKAALAGDVKPIFCIGELLEEREAAQTDAVLKTQITKGLKDISAEDMANITIAYEPVWAIGTGKVASPEQAQAAHAFTRETIKALYNDTVAANVRIQYGGSVKPDNAATLLSQPDVDGALVGGASLKVEDFMGIINNA